MGLYEVIDEIAEKQILKTETGDNRIFGVVVGLVVNNYDSDMQGRVCVTVPTRDKEANELKWARVAMPSGGSKWGHYFLPEIGDQVLLAFEQGNIEKPYVVGCIQKDSDAFLSGAADEQNQYKRIITKNGNMLAFEDNKEGEGEKDKITITTAQNQHSIQMDNENKKIVIKDKEANNKLEIFSENGTMNIRADSKLTIEVGDNISMVFNASDGSVKIKCSKFEVNATDNTKIHTDGMLKFEGANSIVEATSNLKLKSSGVLTLEGTPIKIG